MFIRDFCLMSWGIKSISIKYKMLYNLEDTLLSGVKFCKNFSVNIDNKAKKILYRLSMGARLGA